MTGRLGGMSGVDGMRAKDGKGVRIGEDRQDARTGWIGRADGRSDRVDSETDRERTGWAGRTDWRAVRIGHQGSDGAEHQLR